MWASQEVARWWAGIDPAAAAELLFEPEEDTVPLVIEEAGEPVGYIQYYDFQEPEYRHAGIDLALHPAVQGRGWVRRLSGCWPGGCSSRAIIVW